MPTASEMLDLLAFAAARARFVAVGWHVVLFSAIVAAARGWLPSGRAAGAWVASSCGSVAVVSAYSRSPFNAIVFAVLAIVLAATSFGDRSAIAPRPSLGFAALAFGWIYPHFTSWPLVLVAAPVGVVPCATLYVVGGATLAGFAPRGAAYRWTVAIAALFYGVVGMAKLGVWVDAGLIIVHAMCIHDAHASSHDPRRARAHGLPDRKHDGASVGVRAKFDGQRANRSP